MTGVLTAGWLKLRLAELHQKQQDLQKEEGYLCYIGKCIQEETEKLESKQTVDPPFNLGVVGGTVELLKQKERWMDKREIATAFLAGGYKTASSNPVESIASSLNGEIRKKTLKGLPSRIVRENGEYGLPDQDWRRKVTSLPRR